MLTAHYGAFRRAKTTPSRCQELSVGPVYFFGPFLGFFDFFFELAPLSDATTLLALLCCARLPGRKETISWAVGCRSAMVSTSQATASPNFASKYSLESSRRDLHNVLFCTVFGIHKRKFSNLNFFVKIAEFFADFLQNFHRSC